MKTISLWQPWASLMAVELKMIETRGWYTSYRGPLAIHATKGFPAEAQELAEYFMLASPEVERRFEACGYRTVDDLPRGAVVAVTELVDCKKMTPEFLRELSDDERPFGYYEVGRFAWICRNTRRLDKPVPVRGAQGLWEIPEGVELV